MSAISEQIREAALHPDGAGRWMTVGEALLAVSYMSDIECGADDDDAQQRTFLLLVAEAIEP